MNRLAHIWVSLSLLAACNSQDRYREDIQANAYLQKHIGRTLAQLDTLHLEGIDEARRAKLDKLQTIEQVLATSGDTLDGKTALFLKALAQDGEPYHPSSVERARMEARLNRSHEQLAALNHDLEHNLLPKDSVGWMLREERRRANEAIDGLEKILEKFESERLMAEIWITRVDSFIEAKKTD